MSALAAALTKLAAVVPDRPVTSVDGCGYCYTDDELARLAGPAAAVPSELLPHIAVEVTDHWGDFPAFYRRYAPRIMAELVQGRLFVDEELVAARLRQAGAWTTWPAAERTALLAVCRAWWDETLAVHPRDPTVTETLACLTATPLGLAYCLDVWASRLPGAAAQVAALRRAWGPDLATGRLVVGWDEDLDITAPVTRWLDEHDPLPQS